MLFYIYAAQCYIAESRKRSIQDLLPAFAVLFIIWAKCRYRIIQNSMIPTAARFSGCSALEIYCVISLAT